MVSKLKDKLSQTDVSSLLASYLKHRQYLNSFHLPFSYLPDILLFVHLVVPSVCYGSALFSPSGII